MIIGSRGSELALIQSGLVKDWLEGEGVKVRIKNIKTEGDRFGFKLLGQVDGIFIKELEESLLKEEIDLAVHSMKDIPSILDSRLKIVAVSRREDARDVLIASGGKDLSSLSLEGGRIGTSSIRRRVQLLYHYPNLKMVDIRGNVDSRIQKLRQSDLDGIILAMAGVKRLGRANEVTELIPIEVMVPAVGQGVIGVEIRVSDEELGELLRKFNDWEVEKVVEAERACMHYLGLGCHMAFGAYGRVKGKWLKLLGMVGSSDGKMKGMDFCEGLLEDGVEVGVELGKKLLKKAK